MGDSGFGGDDWGADRDGDAPRPSHPDGLTMPEIREIWPHDADADGTDERMCLVGVRADAYFVGYVQTDIGIEPWANSYDDLNRAAPEFGKMVGGLTYGPDADGWVGFDTVHAGATSVDETGSVLPNCPVPTVGARVVWTPADVRAACVSVADVLVELEAAEALPALDSE